MTGRGSPSLWTARATRSTSGRAVGPKANCLASTRRYRRCAVTGGWTAGDEFRADIVSLTSPHRLQLRAETGEEATVEASWYLPPL